VQSLALRGGIVPVRLRLVGEPALEADDRDGRVRQAGRIARQAALADTTAVLVIAEVAHIMDPVPDFPVPAAPRQHLTRPGHVRTERSDAVYRFRRGLAGLEHGSFAHDAKGLAVARQRHEALVIVARSKHIALQTGRGPCRRSRDRSCRPIEASAGPAHGGRRRSRCRRSHWRTPGCGRHRRRALQRQSGNDPTRPLCGAPAPTCRRGPVHSPARQFTLPDQRIDCDFRIALILLTLLNIRECRHFFSSRCHTIRLYESLIFRSRNPGEPGKFPFS